MRCSKINVIIVEGRIISYIPKPKYHSFNEYSNDNQCYFYLLIPSTSTYLPQQTQQQLDHWMRKTRISKKQCVSCLRSVILIKLKPPCQQ